MTPPADPLRAALEECVRTLETLDRQSQHPRPDHWVAVTVESWTECVRPVIALSRSALQQPARSEVVYSEEAATDAEAQAADAVLDALQQPARSEGLDEGRLARAFLNADDGSGPYLIVHAYLYADSSSDNGVALTELGLVKILAERYAALSAPEKP